MPKLKTNSGAKKRFRITKNGKVMSANGYKNHLLESKSSKRKRRLRGTGTVDAVEAAKVKRLMPYA
ncbi:MAG: 50S ribosomal protein L35 [Leptospirales bacterium]|nr:50S ribosomal protein L35 [Leptospirales bacterium]